MRWQLRLGACRGEDFWAPRIGHSVSLGLASDCGIGIFFSSPPTPSDVMQVGSEPLRATAQIFALSLDSCSWTTFSMGSAWSRSHVTDFCPVGAEAVCLSQARLLPPMFFWLLAVWMQRVPQGGRGAESHHCFHQPLLLCHMSPRKGQGREGPFILLRQWIQQFFLQSMLEPDKYTLLVSILQFYWIFILKGECFKGQTGKQTLEKIQGWLITPRSNPALTYGNENSLKCDSPRRYSLLPRTSRIIP